MAAPGISNPQVLARIRGHEAAFARAVAERMTELGVEPELIGMKGVPGVEDGAFTRYPGPQGGGNLRPDHPNVAAGRWQPGINVDEAVFDATFEALAGEPRVTSAEAAIAYHAGWARATDATRTDAVIAHEYAELKAVSTPELVAAYGNQWPHYAAIQLAPDTPLAVVPEARELLRLQRLALGLE